MEVLLELSRDILEKGKSVRFQAKGWSMRPFIRDGDFIVVSPIENSSIKTGDVVFYLTTENKVIVHRVIKKYKKKGRMTVLIKGDASFGPPEKMDIQNVLGKVIAIERNGRKKRLDTKLYQIKSLLFAGISPFSQWIYPIGSVVKHSGRMLMGRYFKGSVKS
jgi:signal peptidase I